MQSFTIAGSDAGLQDNKKPFLLPDKAFPVLQNAYVWRDRVKKREGLKLLGRLQRLFSGLAFGNFNANPQPSFTGNLFITAGIVDPNATISPGSVTLTTGTIPPFVFSDINKDGMLITTSPYPSGYYDDITLITKGATTVITAASAGLALLPGDKVYLSGINGTFELNNNYYTVLSTTPTTVTLNVNSTTFGDYISGGTIQMVAGAVNYNNGSVVLIVNSFFSGTAVTASFAYNPNLPVMGIWQREIPAINDEETVFFDTTYAYKFVGSAFQEFTAAGTTWSGTDSDFFWATNWRGSTPDSRLFFVTNFVNNSANAMRYTTGGAWTNFAPVVAATVSTVYLTQARILIPYYGRLLALNVWESPDSAGSPNYGAGINIFNRCRFSAIGDPTAADAWRSDLFGKGGFIDAPTSEQIVSAIFYKNTLIVYFERTTWQLRYVGEYGIPFIWERISSDFGSESTFSTVLFDQGVAAIGERAIISSNAVTVDRIDLQIPDLVFDMRNALNGLKRVVGIRDYQKELVYWCYNDVEYSSSTQFFPNKVLVYNYRNNTYAIFRDNVTFFGTFQSSVAVTWDSETVFWDDEVITWDTPFYQSQFPNIVSGNQRGFVHYYANQTPDDPSLVITVINLAVSPIQLTVPDHNLVDGETIRLTNVSFIDGAAKPISTNLNDIFLVRYIDDDTIAILKWDFTSQQYNPNFSFTPPSAGSFYLGGGLVTILPKLEVQTKDFNPYLTKGGQAKLAYLDFLTDATPSALMTVNLYANTQVGDPSVRANILVGNRESETYLTPPYYGTPSSDMAWHRFYCTLAAQFIRIEMTYDDNLMNQLTTHQQTWVLNAITLWTRPGGRNPF